MSAHAKEFEDFDTFGTTTNTKQLVDEEGKEFHFRNLGHIQDKLKGQNIKHRKKRINENKLDRIVIANYLRENKRSYTANQLDRIFGYKDTASHWFRLDKGFSFPSVDDWLKLKFKKMQAKKIIKGKINSFNNIENLISSFISSTLPF